jgi:two-component system, chemotaxis family, chemotaxis protein CheY
VESLNAETVRESVLAERRAAGPAPAAAPSLRILVVQDEFVSARMAVRLLFAHGTCTLCSCAEEALDAYRQASTGGHPFDLTCLDVRMPGMGGLEMLRALRAWEERRGILLGQGVPVIMTTINRAPATVMGAFNSGCEKYLLRPLSVEGLRGALEELGLTMRTAR